MVSLEEVINAIDNAYILFKQYVAQNEDYFNMSDMSEMLNENFKDMIEIVHNNNSEDSDTGEGLC